MNSITIGKAARLADVGVAESADGQYNLLGSGKSHSREYSGRIQKRQFRLKDLAGRRAGWTPELDGAFAGRQIDRTDGGRIHQR